MARLEGLTDLDAAPPEARAVVYFAEREGGPDPRVARIFGRTEAGVARLQAWQTVLFGGLLPHRLKELVRIRMSVLEECGYCSSIRTRRGRLEGLTDEVLLALSEYETSEHFSESERAALHYADLFRADKVDNDKVYEDLLSVFTEEEVIELGILCGWMLGGRFVKSLQVIGWDEACELSPTLQS